MQHWINKRNNRPHTTTTPPSQPVFWGARQQAATRFARALSQAAQTLAVVFAAIIFWPQAEASEWQALTELKMEQVASGNLLLRLPVQTPGAWRVAPRIHTGFEIDVVADIARTTVSQTFVNPTNDWVEATYVFPLPDDAAVDHLTLEIGERRIVGEIHRREQAKKIYREARDAGKKAALLSQQRPNLFTTAVANIAPREQVVVVIEYQQLVQQQGARFSLRLPLTMTPRFIPGQPQPTAPDRQGSGWSANTDQVPDASHITPPVLPDADALSDHRVSLSARIDVGQPLATLVSRYHRIDVENDANVYRLTLADDTPGDHDIELEWYLAANPTPVVSQFAHRSDDAAYLLTRLQPSLQATTSAAVPRELVMVIDTSGSMQGVSIGQAQSALVYALEQLTSADSFNVIEFNSSARALYPVAQPASDENRRQAMQWVQSLQADGGTNMAPALRMALAGASEGGRLRQVIFVTDGAVGNEEGLFRQIDSELGNTRLFTVGIGSAPNGWFMRKAAEAGRGSVTTISAVAEVAERMQALFQKIAQPVLTDIRFDWLGAEVEHYPEVIRDLYADEPVSLLARADAGALPPVLLLRATHWRGGQPEPWLQRIEIDWRAVGEQPGVGVAFARRKIEALADERRRGRDADEVREAIASVALAHHLVSEATSLVAVDQTPARTRQQQLQRRDVASLAPYGTPSQTLSTLVPTATPAALKRLVGGLLIALALAGLALSRRRGLLHRFV